MESTIAARWDEGTGCAAKISPPIFGSCWAGGVQWLFFFLAEGSRLEAAGFMTDNGLMRRMMAS